VAELGLGMAAIGRPAYITAGRAADLPSDRSVEALAARARDLLDAARSLGISYLDAARSYGRAEQFLARWLPGVQPPPRVASKWGYAYTAGWRLDAPEHEVKDHSLAAFDRQFAETTALLGPWLRLYQVHSLTADSPLWDDRALLARLAEVAASGLALGFSTSGPAQADAVRRGVALTHDGVRLFSSVQATWNPLEPSAGPALAEARDAGLRVVVKEALANGRLTDPAELRGTRLAETASRTGVGPDAVALAAALAQPWCDVVLCGAVTVPQLHGNVAARDLVAVLDPGDLVAPEPPERYWAARSRRSWS
jgi:aryl-alcohol dehydrogenase-like predicted oxidoreductase